MPVIESNKRSLRKSLKNREVNLVFKKDYKALAKEYVAKPTVELLTKLFSTLDKGVKSHVFHRNKAARLKSQFSKKLSPAKSM